MKREDVGLSDAMYTILLEHIHFLSFEFSTVQKSHLSMSIDDNDIFRWSRFKLFGVLAKFSSEFDFFFFLY